MYMSCHTRYGIGNIFIGTNAKCSKIFDTWHDLRLKHLVKYRYIWRSFFDAAFHLLQHKPLQIDYERGPNLQEYVRADREQRLQRQHVF